MPTSADDLEAMTEELMALSTAPIPLASDYSDDAAAHQQALEAWMISTAVAADALSQYESSDLYAAATDAQAAEDLSSEEAMIEAMVAGLNATGAGPLTVDDMSPEMIEWVAAQLGVGDDEGLIDAYLAQMDNMDVPVAPEEPDAGEEGTDG
jgi:hypothetical protein